MAGNTSIEIRNMGVSILDGLYGIIKSTNYNIGKLLKNIFLKIYIWNDTALSSFSARGEGNNRPGDFTVKFSEPIVLESNYQYKVGLNRVISMSFSWFNVNSGYKNQTIFIVKIIATVLQI